MHSLKPTRSPIFTALSRLGVRAIKGQSAPPIVSAPIAMSSSSPPAAAAKVVAEYAKSGRSGCKGCGEPIAAGALRLGIVARDRRGFDATKWHHLDCFKPPPEQLQSAEDINGFSFLHKADQELLKEWESGQEQAPDPDAKQDDFITEEPKEKISKKIKDEKASLAGREKAARKSVEEPKKIVSEYAKSGKSSCKSCGNPIVLGSLRLGVVNRDPRGFDMTKWHHPECLRSESLLVSIEEIEGFSSLKSCDQELLKMFDSTGSSKGAGLESPKQSGHGGPASDPLEDQKFEGSEELKEKNSKKQKVDKNDDIRRGKTKKMGLEEVEKVVAEYAKSSRSSCKSCDKAIPSGALRLGLINRGPQGFEMTRWHHAGCLKSQPQLIGSVEGIEGFSSLKSDDQEVLRKLGSSASSNQDNQEVQESLLGSGSKEKVEIDFSISLIMDKYKDAILSHKWKAFQTVIFRERDDSLRDSEKIAAFDFDGCLVNTSVKRTGPDAWSLMYESVPRKLRTLFDQGYKLVIFTNESNIERWKNKRQVAIDSKIGRIDNFIKHVNVPMQAFIACGLGKSNYQTVDPFRKPKAGMWRLMADHFNSGITIDMDQSFYVGDAAGRRNDHSDADIKFAHEVGLKFYVPEEYFGA